MASWYLVWTFVLRLGVVAFAVYLAYYFLFQGHFDFTIQVREGQVLCKGKIALAQQQSVAAFLLDEMCLQGPVKILGRRNQGRISLAFRGRLSPGEQQRIRNFFATTRA